MKKVILGTFLGFTLLIGGLALAIFALRSFETNYGIFLLILAVIMVAASVYVLYRAGTLETNKLKFKEIGAAEPDPKAEERLKKNNEIIAEWNKTNKSRDQLKVLEAAAAAEDMPS